MGFQEVKKAGTQPALNGTFRPRNDLSGLTRTEDRSAREFMKSELRSLFAANSSKEYGSKFNRLVLCGLNLIDRRQDDKFPNLKLEPTISTLSRPITETEALRKKLEPILSNTGAPFADYIADINSIVQDSNSPWPSICKYAYAGDTIEKSIAKAAVEPQSPLLRDVANLGMLFKKFHKPNNITLDSQALIELLSPAQISCVYKLCINHPGVKLSEFVKSVREIKTMAIPSDRIEHDTCQNKTKRLLTQK